MRLPDEVDRVPVEQLGHVAPLWLRLPVDVELGGADVAVRSPRRFKVPVKVEVKRVRGARKTVVTRQ